MPVIERPGARDRVHAILKSALGRAAGEARKVLRENLSQAGSGIHHPGQPRRSSAPGEYPAPQTFKLRDSIDARAVGDFTFAVGTFDIVRFEKGAGIPYPLKLEMYPPDKGGRQWLTRTAFDPETHARMLAAVRGGT
jgi:hypothetical protein